MTEHINVSNVKNKETFRIQINLSAGINNIIKEPITGKAINDNNTA